MKLTNFIPPPALRIAQIMAMWMFPFPDVRLTPTSPKRLPNSFWSCSIVELRDCFSFIVMYRMFSLS